MFEPKYVCCEKVFKNRRKRKPKLLKFVYASFYLFDSWNPLKTQTVCERPCYFAYAEWKKHNQDLYQLLRNEEYLCIMHKLAVVFLLRPESEHSRRCILKAVRKKQKQIRKDLGKRFMNQKAFNFKRHWFPCQSCEHRTHIRNEAIKQKIYSSGEVGFYFSTCIVCGGNDLGPMVVVLSHQRERLLMKHGVVVYGDTRCCLKHTNELKELNGESFYTIEGKITGSHSLLTCVYFNQCFLQAKFKIY